jgi:hypothetical protein
MRQLLATLAVSAALLFPSTLTATPILGGQLHALPGSSQVSVEVLESESGFSNQIGLYEEDGHGGFVLVQEIGRDEQTGLTLDLGHFSDGRELIFGVQTPDHLFLMGPAGRNADGFAHAYLIPTAVPNTFRVAFEDLWRLGDADFNDAIIEVRQIVSPEPASLAVWCLAGLTGAGLGWWKSRRRRWV